MPIVASLPNRLREVVEQELAPDERIVWMEMPAPHFFTPKSTGMFLFGIPWTGFALFWTYSVAQFEMPDFSSPASLGSLFGIPFVVIGILMLLAPIWSYQASRRSVYVITEKRAISFEYGMGMTIRSYSPAQLQETFRRERQNGYGDVVITYAEWEESEGGERHKTDVGFMDIRDPKYVEDLLRGLAAKAYA